MTDNQARVINCPTCDKQLEWSPDNKYRPFCSERCKLIDFGDWASEKNSIAGDPVYLEDDDGEGPLQ